MLRDVFMVLAGLVLAWLIMCRGNVANWQQPDDLPEPLAPSDKGRVIILPAQGKKPAQYVVGF